MFYNTSNLDYCSPLDGQTYYDRLVPSVSEALMLTLVSVALTAVGHIAKHALSLHETGQRKITWAAKHIKQCATSLCLGFYHKLQKKRGGPNKYYHNRECYRHKEQGWNSYYKLLSQPNRVYITDLKEWLLIPTCNKPKKSFMKKKGQDLLKKQLKTLTRSFPADENITFDISKHLFDELHYGVCAGISLHFIEEFYTNKKEGLLPIDAAIKAARLFKEGATRKACLYQQFQHITNIHTPLEDSLDTFIDLKSVTANYAFAKQNFMIDNYKTLSQHIGCTFYSLDEGVYFVGTNHLKSVAITPRSCIIRYINKPEPHATAVIVDGHKYLIFDPNRGLMQTIDPNRYYDCHNTDECGVTICARIVPK